MKAGSIFKCRIYKVIGFIIYVPTIVNNIEFVQVQIIRLCYSNIVIFLWLVIRLHMEA